MIRALLRFVEALHVASSPTGSLPIINRAASDLAKHGAAKRAQSAAATKAETTERLRMEIAAGYVAHMRERSHG